ncbi:MAG: PDZ domain-containing protein [Clostridia bacterium]|nr:PDZ domain-containing protein [Clostridia bacterium]
MNKKISMGVAVAIVIAFVTATFAVTMSVSQRIYNRLISNLQDRLASYSLIDELDSVVRSNYYGTVDESVRNGDMLAGYVKSLNDESSFYLDPAAYSAYTASINGEINGIGISASFDAKSGYILVSNVIDGSPADSAGLKSGDLISVIDGEAVNKDNYSELLSSLNGNKLTSVKITFNRAEKTKTVSVMMGYSSKSVSSKKAGDDTVYIKIDGFYSNTAQQLKDVISDLSDNVKSIIFDVRGTSTGTVEYTCDTLKLIVPLASEGSGALATETDKNGKTVFYASNASSLSDYNIVVLTNGATSCCGELFACDIRDFDMGVIAGETTAGNADVQKGFMLSNGSGVVLTVAKVTPYITETFENIGVRPDIEVPPAEDGKADTQLQAALSYLSSK